MFREHGPRRHRRVYRLDPTGGPGNTDRGGARAQHFCLTGPNAERRLVTPETRVRFPSGVPVHDLLPPNAPRFGLGPGYDASAVESRWHVAWERAGCFRAPRRPTGPKYFNYDSGPFPNGPLHMGHVRTYVLGDATARYQRLLGKSVLYATEWDAFGLPNELAAYETGVAPRVHTDRCIAIMREQLRALGISYDWSRVRSTCDPGYMRGTQRLFLDLRAAGLVDQREAELPFCSSCVTTVARMQVDAQGRCWRCGTAVATRSLRQWCVVLSRHSDRLRDGLDNLREWSDSSKALLRGFIGSAAGSHRVHDWVISRQRSWGTPIPVVHCPTCGPVSLRAQDLPLLLPDDLDWTGGPHPLASHPSFADASCPECGAAGRRETDTLDCFFDDVWCFLASLVRPNQGLEDGRDSLAAWLPVDRFHAGLDTFFYLHLHRFLGIVLHERGIVSDPELIRSYVGHEMVLARGRKMSKHLGNAVSPEAILRTHGADALRVGMLWAAGPQRGVEWRADTVDKARHLLAGVHELYARCAPICHAVAAESSADASRAARDLANRAAETFARVGGFIEEYRMNAAIEEWAGLARAIRTFAEHRIASRRLVPADAATLRTVLTDAAVALSPFAPHLSEECRSMLGDAPFSATARWPGRASRDSG